VFFVDPATGAVTNAGTSDLLPGLTRDVAVTADRKLLFASEGNDKVVHYDPATGAFTTFADLPANSQVRSIVATRDGGAYVSTDPAGEDPVLYRISPQGLVTPFLIDPGLGEPYDMTLSADERTLFVATRNGAQDVKAVDLGTKAVTVRATGDAPASAALLPDGSIVFSDYGADAVFKVAPGAITGTLLSDDSEFAWVTDVLVEPERCAGLVPTVVGTTGRDVLLGSVHADVFLTLGGNDVVRGLAGDDVVCAGDGNDTVFGGPGRDRLLGGAGKDKLRGKAGNDTLLGQAGRDLLAGGKGKDKLRGGKGKDAEKQ
jgi:Ca2+-binding RTX toxin-like protein